jgi:transcriptional regulator with XRE-family HTH domain
MWDPQAFRTARVNAGLTQTELARRLKVSQTAISRWELGTAPHVSLLCSAARVLGVNAADFLGAKR